MPAESDIAHLPIAPLLDDALGIAKHVSSPVALLSDLYGEVGISRQDADATQLSRTLDMIREEAVRVERLIEQAADNARVTAPGARPSPSGSPRRHRTAAVRQ